MNIPEPMNTKLTLKLEQTIIEKAKLYAKLQNTSLSKVIEKYLQDIIGQNDKSKQITPLVKSLSGIIDLPEEDGSQKGAC